MKNKISKPMLVIALTIGFGLTSCEKECFGEFKKEISNEFKKGGSNCDSSSAETPPQVNSRKIK